MYGNGYGYGGGMAGGMQGYGGGYGAMGGFQGGYGGGAMNDGFAGEGASYQARPQPTGGRGAGSYGVRPASGMGAGAGAAPRPRMDQEFVEGKLFLGGLDNATSKDTLLEYCGQWGEVSDYVLMEGRGFGFVTYRDPQNAQQFLEQREHVIDGKKVEAKAAVPKNSGNSPTLTRKMFVGGTGEIGDEEFREYFLQFGEIEDSVVLRKPDGGSRGFGFVTFKDEMSVEKCLVMQHQLNGKQVEIKRAVRKEEMGGSGGGAGGSTGGGGYAPSAGGSMRGGKEQDWICPDANCHNKNFGWRQACNRCQIPKPAHLKTGGGMAGGMGMGMAAGMGGGMAAGMGAGMGGANTGYGGRMGGEYEQAGPGYGAAPGMGMGGMGMGGYGNFPAAAYGNGMGGYGAMSGYGAMGGGMGGFPAAAAAGYGAQSGYGAAGGGGGYGRSQGGRGGGAGTGRYRPY